MSRGGLAAMNPEQALELLDAALLIDHPVVVATRLDRAALDTRPTVAGCRRCSAGSHAARGDAKSRTPAMPPNRSRRWPNVCTGWPPTNSTTYW